jgi:hypothetical protein
VPTYTHFAITNINEQEIKNIDNTLHTDIRCKSLRITSPCRLTGYIEIRDENQINALMTEFLSKFTTCKRKDIAFSPPIPIRHFSLPDDKLRLKKVQKVGIPTAAGYCSGVVAGLGTNYNSITYNVFYQALAAAILPAVAALFIRIKQGYED